MSVFVEKIGVGICLIFDIEQPFKASDTTDRSLEITDIANGFEHQNLFGSFNSRNVLNLDQALRERLLEHIKGLCKALHLALWGGMPRLWHRLRPSGRTLTYRRFTEQKQR